MKRTVLLCLATLSALSLRSQSLAECQQAAEQNYPLIRQYDLISRTTELSVSNLKKTWLPQLSATAQATLQSDVTAWPDEMEAMLRQTGLDIKGLSRAQYRAGIDLSQTLYDGGTARQQMEVARLQGASEEAQTGVGLYALRSRVNEMYFALLLLDERIRLNRDLQTLLEGNEKKLNDMFRHGTAAESDWLSVRAERLNTVQELSSLESQRATLSRMLSLFCGLEVTRPMKPETAADALVPNDGDGSLRPEVQFLDRQLQLTDARERLLDKALRPRLTLFAQGFYGYPGYNLFEDMTHRNGSWNGIVGARLSWNIGALYTYRNDKARLEAERNSSRMQRDVFLFNNRLESTQHSEETARFRRMMAEDDEIVSLRRAVRLAAESKLAHGIIDVNDLLREINAENSAMVRRAIHEIEMLRELHSLRITLNR